MDKSLQELEAQLEKLVPRGLSDQGQADCEAVIDRLSEGGESDLLPTSESPLPSAHFGLSWKASAAAAAIILAVGLGSGWQLGKSTPAAPVVAEDKLEFADGTITFSFSSEGEIMHAYRDGKELPPAEQQAYLKMITSAQQMPGVNK